MPARCEGAFEELRTGNVAAPMEPAWLPDGYKGRQPCTGLLTPEVEWVLVFPDANALSMCLNGKGDWASLTIEIRAMIEGKWFDALLEDSDGGAKWRRASLGNNVVALHGFTTKLGSLEAYLQNPDAPGFDRFRALWAEAQPGNVSELCRPKYTSRFSDYAAGELNVRLQKVHPGVAMRYLIVKINERLPEGHAKTAAINLSCFGSTPALVSKPCRRIRAFICASPTFLLHWDRDELARHALKSYVRRVLEEDLKSVRKTGKRHFGLNEGEHYRLTSWLGDEQLGTAVLSIDPVKPPTPERSRGHTSF